MKLLGATGVKVSPIALGTMACGGDADEATARAIWRAARDAGVNLFDTADVYNAGRSEEILGRLMQGERDQIVLATKAYFPTGAGPNDRGTSRYHLVRAVEASLRRLATDRIDLYYLHRFDDVTALDETLRGIEDLVRAGKILYPACSNFAAWQVAHALGIQRHHGWAPVVALQPMYNLVKRQAEVEILPMAQSLGLAVIPYNATGGGLLTGKYAPGRPPPRGRLSEDKMYSVRYADPRYLTIAGQFTALAAELGHALDKPIDIQHIDRRDVDNIRRRVVNIEKARRMLRWTPQITLERGLASTAEWFVRSEFAAEGSLVRP